MLIDWFTVMAQIINFVILVALLKRFLYRPILRAMDERERQIAEQMDSAEQAKASAVLQREEYRQKNENLDRQLAERLQEIDLQVTRERDKKLDEARIEADAIVSRRRELLKRDSLEFEGQFQQELGKAVCAAADRILQDLSGIDLESRIIEVFLDRLPSEIRQRKESASSLIVQSAYPIQPDQKQQMIRMIRSNLGGTAEIKFNQDPNLLCGIQLSWDDQTITWSLSQHLSSLRNLLTEAGTLPAEQPAEGDDQDRR